MINKVILVGNVGADPEVRTLESGVKTARVRLATSERYYNRETQQTTEHTEWHTITLWRGLADVVDRYVRKGSQLYIEGRLRTREWTDKDNIKRYTTEILADEMKLLGARGGVFPHRLALQDYFIQDPRYLQCYADMFCRFIELYAEQGLPITKVMYQNEAYSYTPYPGCAWTAEGTLRFNNEYLAPTLAAKHPEVELWIGTFNTNRLDYVQKILDDSTLQKNIKGVGTQWECRYNLPELRKRYPNLRFMQSESECGNGSMDWRAGEHTFMLIADNLGNGCDEYYNWNFILQDNGSSSWGWTQNALIQVNSATREMRYTPEYYAYKHFSHFVAKGTEMVGYSGRQHADTPVVVFKNENGYIVAAGNFADDATTVCVKIGDKYLNMRLPAHSFNTFVER